MSSRHHFSPRLGFSAPVASLPADSEWFSTVRSKAWPVSRWSMSLVRNAVTTGNRIPAGLNSKMKRRRAAADWGPNIREDAPHPPHPPFVRELFRHLLVTPTFVCHSARLSLSMALGIIFYLT